LKFQAFAEKTAKHGLLLFAIPCMFYLLYCTFLTSFKEPLIPFSKLCHMVYSLSALLVFSARQRSIYA